MKKLSILVTAIAGGVAAFGISGFWNYGWPDGARLEIAIGIALLLTGAFLRQDSK